MSSRIGVGSSGIGIGNSGIGRSHATERNNSPGDSTVATSPNVTDLAVSAIRTQEVRPASSLSSKHLSTTISYGMMSAQDDRRRRDQTDAIIGKVVSEFARMQEQIQQAIQDFHKESKSSEQASI